MPVNLTRKRLRQSMAEMSTRSCWFRCWISSSEGALRRGTASSSPTPCRLSR
ncbi:hypothetical protein SLEP1_g34343 [Rubroshorea leprosula]|uniref:Uncharacterized protein n=1 Tax=Rubroshorea leprosula TaxID=152421 RepID=A0AAV5KJJ2_9ROSI|nr:hypothetical protein SLEP1_g34343 [Rubroshorea leprosula]